MGETNLVNIQQSHFLEILLCSCNQLHELYLCTLRFERTDYGRYMGFGKFAGCKLRRSYNHYLMYR